ncbi:MAG: hypothetical protein U5N58_13970 [Actinomycetota bacterium]|nr:hypothetical protein [Actinomycetota bacterium]
MIEKAGGINIVASDGLEGYAEYSVEKLLDNNPRLLVAGDGGMYEARTGEIILEDPRFSTVSGDRRKGICGTRKLYSKAQP